MDEQQFLTPKDVLGYAEEYIVVEEIQELLNYSLSNSLDDIKIAVYARTGLNINLNNAYWQLNTNLSTSVKRLMNKHRVTYSMTTWYEEEDKTRFLCVNMRVVDQWFLSSFFAGNKDNTFLDFEKFKCCTKVFNFLDDPDTAVKQIKHILR
jgi:hypothetical protein